ncbi:MAG: pseudouridine synthase [Planctomycetota bacterium]|jgi:23S rRNA pseudouridine2605 synthase
MNRQRLHKLMAACGVGSRRACEEIIAQGRVEVDGQIVTRPGTQVDPETQVVRCDGSTLRTEPQLYYLLNKPRGVICSHTSRPGTQRAVDFAPARGRDRRLFTIGRLDVDSDGALILTNDGELCHLLTHPRFGVRKTYFVEVEGAPDDETIERMRRGVWLAEGRTGPVEVHLLHRGRQKTSMELTLQEGKRREIRRLCARHGHEVRKLTRVAIGPVRLGRLQPGQTRLLDRDEVAALRETADVVIRLGGNTGPRRSARSPAARAETKRGTKPTGKRGAKRGTKPSAKRVGKRTSKGKPAAKAARSRASKRPPPKRRAGRGRS